MKQARAMGTVVLERLVAELRGVPSGVVETIEPQRKGMAVGLVTVLRRSLES
jgi:DNA polymerase V